MKAGRLLIGVGILAVVAGLGMAVHYATGGGGGPVAPGVTRERVDKLSRSVDQQSRAAPPRLDRRLRGVSADRIAERARGDAPIGPDAPIGQETVDPSGHPVIILPGGITYYGRPGDNRRKHPDVMSKVEMLVKRPDLVKLIGDNIDLNEHRFCAQAVVDRKPVDDTLRLLFALHVTAKNGKLVVDDVEPLGDGWPAHLIQADVDCFVSAFRGLEIPWDKPESFWFESSYSINPPPVSPKSGVR